MTCARRGNSGILLKPNEGMQKTVVKGFRRGGGNDHSDLSEAGGRTFNCPRLQEGGLFFPMKKQ